MMGIYLKRFIYVSLFYLGAAAIIGALNGIFDLEYGAVFAHSHFNLLGFMSMMIYGVGYFILPRFNGKDIKYPSWIPIHFWLGNISLFGMVIFRYLEVSQGDNIYNILFVISAALQTITIFMFIINIWITLYEKPVSVNQKDQKKQPETTTASKKKTIMLSEHSRISDLIESQNSLLEILANAGLMALKMPGHLEKVKTMGITIGQACNNHSLDLEQVMGLVSDELKANGFDVAAVGNSFQVINNSTENVTSSNEPITLQTLIGDVINNHPESRQLFEKHFGSGCFDCPGQSYESIDMACRMHSVNPDEFLKELKTVLN